MRLASRTTLYAASIGVHAVLGVCLGTMRPPKHRETVAISFTETKKARPPAPAELPKEPDPPRPPPGAPLRAKAAPKAAAKSSVTPLANAPAVPGLAALPDFGLSLGGPSSGGFAVPSGGLGPAPVAAAVSKKLTRAVAPKPDECTEAAVKPRALSRPVPAYTADARAAGIAGRVRVEIVIDEHGRVVSARVLAGLGHGLDEAALAAARAMTFEAGVRCGKPVSATFKVGFTFSPAAT